MQSSAERVRAMNTDPVKGTQFATEVRHLAEEAFDSGLYCAEAVVSALAKAQGVDSELIPKMATAFCSGMSRTCGPCGALTGAIMGLSLSLGRSNMRQCVDSSYAATQELVRTFENEFGGRNCDQLLGCDLGTAEGQAKFREQHLHSRCARYTARAAEIAATLLAKNES
jgi:C_GCAxxG_C_C family probable redox protein